MIFHVIKGGEAMFRIAMAEGNSFVSAAEAKTPDVCDLSIKDVSVVLKMLERIVDWYSLGTYLEVAAHTLDAIERENVTIKLRLIKMVQQWLRTGQCCSWRKLVEALYLMGEIAVAENIRRKYLSVTTPVLPKFLQGHDAYTKSPEIRAAIALKNRQRIIVKFSSLVTRLRKRFEHLKVDPVDLRTFLTTYSISFTRIDFTADIPPVSHLDTLSLLFDSITRHNIWDYLNFDLASYLVEEFAQDDKKCVDLLEDYQRDFTGYLLTTEIVHHIAAEKEAGTAKPENIPSEELCSKLTVKLDIDVTTHSLKYVEEVWKTLLRRSQLPKHTLLLHEIAQSSLKITWLFPKSKVAEVADAILRNTQELRLKRIYLITINEFDLFQTELDDELVDLLSLVEINKVEINKLVVGEELVKAAGEGKVDLVASLLEQGADVNNSKDEEGRTPLYAGCDSGSTEVVKLLMERGVDVNMRAQLEGEEGSGFVTPLCVALVEGHEEVAALLIEHGADVNTLGMELKKGEDTISVTHLSTAAHAGLQRSTKLLLEHGAEVDKEVEWTKEGETISLTALMRANVEVAKLLLEYGAQVNFQSSHGGPTALMGASHNGLCEVAEFLLDHGAEVDLQDSKGWSALMYAVMKGENEDKDSVGIARLLLQHGANPQLEARDGKTALALAVDQWDTELIELLADPAKALSHESTQQVARQHTGGTAHKKPITMFGIIKGLFSNLRSRRSREVFTT